MSRVSSAGLKSQGLPALWPQGQPGACDPIQAGQWPGLGSFSTIVWGKKKLNFFPWQPFCCHMGAPCFQVWNVRELTSQKEAQKEAQEPGTLPEPLDQAWTKTGAQFSVTWNTKHPVWKNIYLFELIDLFFPCIFAGFYNSLSIDSTNNITGAHWAFLKTLVQVNIIAVDLSHFHVGLEWKRVMVSVSDVPSPRGACPSRFILSCLWCIQNHSPNSVFELSCNQACIFIREEKFSPKKFKLFIDFHFCAQRKHG